MRKLATRLRSYHQGCRHTSMSWDGKRKTILSLLKVAYKLNSYSHSNPSALDRFPILEACRKLSSPRWSSWRNLKTPLCQNPSNSVRQDRVLAYEFSWISKTKSSTLHWRRLSEQVQHIISVSEISKPNNQLLLLSMMRWSKSEGKSWKNRKQRKRKLSRKRLSGTSSKTGFNSVSSAVPHSYQTQSPFHKCVKSPWIARGKNWARFKRPTTRSKPKSSSTLQTDPFWLNKCRRPSSTIWTRSKNSRGTCQSWERLAWTLTSIWRRSSVNCWWVLSITIDSTQRPLTSRKTLS